MFYSISLEVVIGTAFLGLALFFGFKNSILVFFNHLRSSAFS